MLITTIIGWILGVSFVLFAVSSSQVSFIHIPSLIITIGGSIAATLVHFSIKQLIEGLKSINVIFSPKLNSPVRLFNSLMEIAKDAQVLAPIELEKKYSNNEEKLISRGLELISDGVSSNALHSILESESLAEDANQHTGERVFRSLGNYSPMFGLIGTLIGLIQLLANLDKPEEIPPAMAIALITTFYGILASGMFFLPIAGKINSYSTSKLFLREMIVECMVSISLKDDINITRERLSAFIGSNKTQTKSFQW